MHYAICIHSVFFCLKIVQNMKIMSKHSLYAIAVKCALEDGQLIYLFLVIEFKYLIMNFLFDDQDAEPLLSQAGEKG